MQPTRTLKVIAIHRLRLNVIIELPFTLKGGFIDPRQSLALSLDLVFLNLKPF